MGNTTLSGVCMALISLLLWSVSGVNCKIARPFVPGAIVVLDSIYSKALQEYRPHQVYLPYGYRRGQSYPIVWGTDGIQDETKAALDSLITSGAIRPFIYASSMANLNIADSTSVKTGDGKAVRLAYRNFDYIRNNSAGGQGLLGQRFDQHMSYYTNEFMPYIERSFGLPGDPKNRYYYGVSNGAGFGVHLLHRFPERISTYCCYSPFGADPDGLEWSCNHPYPELFWCYGNEEPDFLRDDAAFMQAQYERCQSHFHLHVFDGGHSSKHWHAVFIAWCTSTFKRK